MMTADEVRAKVRAMLKERGQSQQKFANAINVEYGHLNAVLRGRSEPGPRILRAIGMRRVFRYEEVP